MAQVFLHAQGRAVNETPAYREYRPRWIRRRVSTYWWLGSVPYFLFIARELSSIFVAWFVLYLLMLVRALAHGEVVYQEFLVWSGGPFVLILNLVSFVFILFHAITWFNLAPKAMVVHVGSTRVPGFLIAASNYGAWVLASAVVAWLLLGQ
jgi:fumarate reductase subunit C